MIDCMTLGSKLEYTHTHTTYNKHDGIQRRERERNTEVFNVRHSLYRESDAEHELQYNAEQKNRIALANERELRRTITAQRLKNKERRRIKRGGNVECTGQKLLIKT